MKKYDQSNSLFNLISSIVIMKIRLFKYVENFTETETETFQIKKNSDMFHISAQNIDCGYSLEPPLTSTHNLYF